MATVGQINEQDVFTCPICLETLKSPKSLPCLHTFCETCIGEFILSTEQRSEQKLSNYPCPVCRTIVKPTNSGDETSLWASSLPQNFTISSVIDNSKSVKEECHICKRRDIISEATQWCCDCTEAFCEECLQLHGLMKLFANHKIVLIEEIDTSVSVEEPDLSMISNLCPVHTSKVLEAFCFDHQALCCVFCLTLQHRKCEHVQVIEEIKHLKKDKINAFMSEVSDVKAKVETTMNEKRVQKDKLETNFTEIELQAKTSISSLKNKLDSLLALFMKELNINREESEQAFENKLKSFEKLSNCFEKLQSTTKIIQEHGTFNQMFIHLEKSKAEIKSVFTEASSILNTSSISEARLVKSSKLGQDESVAGFIELALIKTIPVEMNAYLKHCFPSNSFVLSKTHPLISFDNLVLKHIKTICLYGFDVYSGVFVSDEVAVVGGEVGKLNLLKAINIFNERNVDKYSSPETVKRLAFDYESGHLFVSCYGSKLYRLKFADVFLNSKINVEVGDHYNGGICISDGVLYVILNKTVKKISLVNSQQSLEMCFKTSTNCTSLNGLGIDSKNNRFLYTSEKQEVVCTSLDGSEIFKYKDEFMKETTSVYVHSEGLVFVGDEKGSMHLISEDGCRRRTVLNSCDKLKTVRDICLDKSCSRLAVFGPSYIELYDVCTATGN